MKHQIILSYKILFIFFLGAFFSESCISYKKTVYFQEDAVDTIEAVSINSTYKLQPGDILNIKIFTPDAKSAEIFNTDKNIVTTSPASIFFNGHSINDSGYVDIPITGFLYVKDYTVMQVDSLITLKSKDYFKYATIEVKLAAFKFLALGEFKRADYHYVYNDKCTIFEAIALAGDATDLANKTQLKLIRTLPDNRKKVYRIDITNYDAFTSETFYIQPNDILYFQPQKAKVDSRNIQYITLGFATISTVILLINYFGR